MREQDRRGTTKQTMLARKRSEQTRTLSTERRMPRRRMLEQWLQGAIRIGGKLVRSLIQHKLKSIEVAEASRSNLARSKLERTGSHSLPTGYPWKQILLASGDLEGRVG